MNIIRNLLTAAALASLVSCASPKKECSDCSKCEKKTECASAGQGKKATGMLKTAAAATPQGQALKAASTAAQKAQ